MARFVLFLFSKVYALAVRVRRILYNFRILRDSTLGVQVIAIGNLTVGGTGKTPVVEKFARELQNNGRTVAILSRGDAVSRRDATPQSSRFVDVFEALAEQKSGYGEHRQHEQHQQDEPPGKAVAKR